jgi:hypothetical protein
MQTWSFKLGIQQLITVELLESSEGEYSSRGVPSHSIRTVIPSRDGICGGGEPSQSSSPKCSLDFRSGEREIGVKYDYESHILGS